MTDLRQAAQQALECIKRLNMRGFILADFEDEVYAAIAALKAVLAQPEQEPTPWREMVVVSLVREGINKHKARELADHFAAQSKQEPVAFYHPRNGFYWAKPTSIFAPTSVDIERLPLYTAVQRKWVGLTYEEIESAISDGFARGLDNGNISNQTVINYVRGIEAKLKELNNG